MASATDSKHALRLFYDSFAQVFLETSYAKKESKINSLQILHYADKTVITFKYKPANERKERAKILLMRFDNSAVSKPGAVTELKINRLEFARFKSHIGSEIDMDNIEIVELVHHESQIDEKNEMKISGKGSKASQCAFDDVSAESILEHGNIVEPRSGVNHQG